MLNGSNELIEIQGTAEKKPFAMSELQNLWLQALPAINSLQTIQAQALEIPELV